MPAPKGNTYAAKPESEKRTGRGRIVVDIGPLKARIVRQLRPKEKLSDWLRSAIERNLSERE